MKNDFGRIVIVLLLVLAAVISLFPVGNWASNPQNFSRFTESVDNSISTVLKLSGVAVGTSAVITMLPGDVATPIAEEMAELTDYFLIILCVLYAEKFMLSIIGLGVFRILIPLCCLLAIACVLSGRGELKRLVVKGLLLGLIVFATIPTSVMMTEMIYERYYISIDETIEMAEEFNGKAKDVSEAEEKGLLAEVWDRISEKSGSMADKAANILTGFVKNIAVLLVTSCVVPVLTLLFMCWVVKLITGVDVRPPMPRPRRRRPGGHDDPPAPAPAE